MIIEEEWVHDALEYLRGNAQSAAIAQGNLVRAEYHIKRIKARLILAAPSSLTSHGAREAWAEAHTDYADIVEKLALCREEVERHRNERSKAETICEMYRTQQATMRSMGRL
jgi:hypothetical protein